MQKFRARLGVAAAFLMLSIPASAGISYTCAADINTDSGVNACGVLNSTIAGLYNSTFTNANASIYIQFASNGTLGESTSGFYNLVAYSTYLSAITSESTDSTAKASLPGTEPAIFGGDDIELTSALAGALGITTVMGGGPVQGTTSSGVSCTDPGVGGCYNGIITLNDPSDLFTETAGQGYSYRNGGATADNYDFYSVVEHETDEVLGTASCISTGGSVLSNPVGCAAAVDLFRYHASGTRTFDTAGVSAYFSPDGGVTDTDGNVYNDQANGNDWADFGSGCTFIQDAEGCPGLSGLDITNDSGEPEIAILNAVGFDLTQDATPEPGTLGLLGVSLITLAVMGSRRNRARRNDSA